MRGIFQNTILLIYTQVTSFFNSWTKCLLNNRQPLKLEKKLTVATTPLRLSCCARRFLLFTGTIIQTEMLQDVLPGSV